jgi:GH18 family chitinase
MWSGLTQQEAGQNPAPTDRDFAFLTMKRNALDQRLMDTAGTLGIWGGAGLGTNFTADVFGYDSTDPGEGGLRECTDPGASRFLSSQALYVIVVPACRTIGGNSGGPIFACEDVCGNSFPPIVIGNISASDADGGFTTTGPAFNVAAWSTWQEAGGVLPAGAPDDPNHDELFAIPSSSGDAPAPASRTAYYTSWSIYANQFYPKDLDTRGIAGKLTTLNYAFENIDPVNLTCMAANKAGSSDDNDTSGNDGAGDAWADYQMGFASDNSVDGSTDAWEQPLKGNFNQLKELKAKYPNLKVLVSLGGWTYSKYFSDVAATDASRKKFVSSCIDMYIKGNLPVLDGSPAGGQGAAAGIFDGFDIDWEFPGSTNGHPGNHVSADDTANYTLLLQEFRRELDALGGKHYSLTAAVPSGPSDIDKIQPGSLAGALDMADVMTYDFYGAWNPTGPTNFNAQLKDSSDNPDAGAGFDVEDAINEYLLHGMPADKLSVGIPFYARGWTGVSDGGSRGRYQSATGPSPAYSLSQQPGVAFYKELEADGKLNSFYMDDATKSTWAYDGTNWWSIETPQSISYKLQYLHSIGLGGVMMYSLEGDDANSTLLNAAVGQ